MGVLKQEASHPPTPLQEEIVELSPNPGGHGGEGVVRWWAKAGSLNCYPPTPSPPNPGGHGGLGSWGVRLEGGYRISGTILPLSYCHLLHLVVRLNDIYILKAVGNIQ